MADIVINNATRAKLGQNALTGYAQEKCTQEEPVTDNAIDLIADLLHYVHSLGKDATHCYETAALHFHAEREEEEDHEAANG